MQNEKMKDISNANNTVNFQQENLFQNKIRKVKLGMQTSNKILQKKKQREAKQNNEANMYGNTFLSVMGGASQLSMNSKSVSVRVRSA